MNPEEQEKNRMGNHNTFLNRKRYYLIGILFASILLLNTEALSSQSTVRVKIVPSLGESINIRKSFDSMAVQTGIIAFDKLNSKYLVRSIERVFPYSEKYEARHKKHGLHLWYDLKITGQFSEDHLVLDYANLSEITHAELKQAPKLIDPQKPVIYDNVITKSAGINDAPFDDPLLDKQWHYHNYGQSGGKTGADIRLFEAWAKATGSPNIIVSVHDQGVEVDHEDLIDAMWINQAEANGISGVDDDNNGYIDDVNGFDFVDESGSIGVGYHGTHVAGTIGATNNNSKGVSGIAGGTGNEDGVRIMSCRILGAEESNIAQSFVYAADNGAVISQNSWGYNTPGDYSEAVHDAIDYFIEEAGNYPGSPMKGGVVIFAAGNLGLEGDFYPAAYEPVVSVTAVSSENIVAPYSNYGTWIDVAAPGGNNADNSVLTGKDKTYSNAIMSTLDNNEYGFLDGTSMACPHVSGIAALIASKFQGSSFTNDELLTHLLTAYNDSIYQIEYNHDYKGKLGLGAVDANMALETDNKIPPKKVSDLRLTGEISQDFVVLQWSVPSDDDDEVAFDYEVIYSESEITTELINEAKILKFKNRNFVNDTITYELANLTPTTNYNFAVRYIDRWGNKAAFSNIIAATTNNGPVVNLNGDSIQIFIDIKKEPSIKKDSIVIKNEGEGLLRWDLEARHSEGVPYALGVAERYAPIKPEAYANKRGVLQSSAKYPIHAYNIEKDHDEEYSDMYSDGQLIVIGESNTELPNSAATRIVVDNSEGFNLTHIDTYYEIDDTTTRAILEIHKGNDINTARVLLSQTIDKPERRFTRVQLDEQLFFEENDTFWVVLHIPPGNLYPLGVGFESTPEGSENAFMSFDYGKSWAMIEELTPDDQLVWAMYAMSRYKKLDEYIQLSPIKGELRQGDSIVVIATVDAENLVDGNYKGNLVVNTNEADRDHFRVAVDVHITGHDPFIQAPPRVDFGNVVIGYTKFEKLTLKNTGLSRFDVKEPYFSFSDPQFEYVEGIDREFDSGDEQEVYFSYKPTAPGLNVAYATIIDENGDNHTFEILGVGLEPPMVELDPENATYRNVTITDTVEGQFIIKNEGKFTLDYFMPAFADGANMENIPENFHRFGYRTTVKEEDDNPKYEWTEISETGVDVTAEIMSSSSKLREIPHVKIDFGFNFPFFGTTEDSVLITSYGLLMFDLHHHMWSRTPLGYNFERNADRWISPFGSLISLALDETAKIYYQKYSDKLIVQYTNANVNDEVSILGKATFQVVLHENGDIYFQYQKFKQEDWFQMHELFGDLNIFHISTMVGIKDRYLNDGVYIQDNSKFGLEFNDRSTIEFINPGLGLFYDVSKSFGAVRPGEADTIQYKIKTDSLNVSTHKELLNIVTNDPNNILIPHGARLEITGGATPILSLSSDTLDFGAVFLGAMANMEATIINDGRAPDLLNSIITPGNLMVEGLDLPYKIAPLKRLKFKVGVNTSQLGEISATIKVFTLMGAQLNLFVKGEIIPAPSISIIPGQINTEYTLAGDSLFTQLTIANTGDHELEFAMQGNEWLKVSHSKTELSSAPIGLPNFQYHVSKSTDENETRYDWHEIADTGEGTLLDIDPYENTFSEPIALPFTFNYYGQEYDSLIVSANGFVTFERGMENEDVEWSWGGVNIPNDANPNNYIAPMWYGGGFAYKEYYPYTGAYYKIFDDRIIVEYKHVLNGFQMGDPMSFQVILYATGHIRFQYLFDENTIDYNMKYAAVGIENQDGTDGIQISWNNPVINKNMSILFVPMPGYHLAAGEQMKMDVLLDASHLYHNVYTYNMPVPNNAPNGVGLEVPVTFNVFGTGEMVLADSIEFGKHMIVNGKENKHTREFTIDNKGRAHFYLTKLEQQKPNKFETEAFLSVPNTMTGEIEERWEPLFQFDETTSYQTPIVIKAGTSLKLRVSFDPELPGTFMDELIVKNSIRFHKGDTIRFYAASELPPVIGVDTNYIETYAISDNVSETREFTVNNSKGGSDLSYEIEVEYARKKKSQTSPYAKASMMKSAGMTNDLSTYVVSKQRRHKSLKTELFNRTLSYENATESEINLGFGGGFEFNAASRFNAPEDGFNLSHVQFWYAPADLLSSSVTINVFSSKGFSPSNLVYTQDYRHVIDAPDADGKLITVELDNPVLFFPEESFYIEIQYGKEQLFPQGLAPIEKPIPNTIFFGNGAQYFDMSESEYANYAWILRAAELEFANSSWIVLNSNSKGLISPGGDQNISFDILAEYADDGENTALIHLKSNDPITPDEVLEVRLVHNSGPQFDLDGTALSVLENDTMTFEVIATDLENDAFTVDVTDLPGFISSEKKDGSILVSCTPQYEDAGNYTLRFEGQDEHFNTSKMKVLLQVLNKNRAPEANEMETLVIGLDQKAVSIKGADLFTDPDGDALELRFIEGAGDIFQTYVSGENYLLEPIQLGESTIKFIASDENGETTENILDILVTTRNTENGGLGWFEPYPNPTTDILFFSTQNVNIIRTKITVTNSLGAIVMIKEVMVDDSRKASIDVSKLGTGIYTLSIANNTGRNHFKFSINK